MFRSLKLGAGFAVFCLSLAVLFCSAPGIGHYLSAEDPNFQLSMGRQVLFHKFPCIDIFTYYGPMVALTSAAGLAVWNCVVPEVVICAVGYSLALTLVFLLGRRCVDSPPWLKAVFGLALYIICVLLLVRFHKWYYWLFPLLVLYCFSRFLDSDADGRGWILLTGLSAGVGWLYRFEVGVACTFAVAIAFLVMAIKSSDLTRFLKRLSLYMAALVMAMAPWFIVLFSLGGIRAGRDYLGAPIVGGAGAFQECSIPIPRFDWLAPFSLNSSHSVAWVSWFSRTAWRYRGRCGMSEFAVRQRCPNGCSRCW